MSCTSSLVTVDCTLRHYHGEHAAHAHDGHAQLLYALQGRMELEVNGRSSYVDTASGLLIPPGARHAYWAEHRACMVVLDVPPHCAPGLLDKQRRFQVPPTLRGSTPVRPAPEHLQHLLQAPLLLPRRHVDAPQLEATVRRRLHEDWPTARMAQHCHLSAARFHTRWLELTGLTPQQWLRQLRLDKAEEWLAQGRSLEATATDCGYTTASALAYALRRDRQQGARSLRAPRR